MHAGLALYYYYFCLLTLCSNINYENGWGKGAKTTYTGNRE